MKCDCPERVVERADAFSISVSYERRNLTEFQENMFLSATCQVYFTRLKGSHQRKKSKKAIAYWVK